MRRRALIKGFCSSCETANRVQPIEKRHCAGPRSGRKKMIRKIKILLIVFESTFNEIFKFSKRKRDRLLTSNDNQVNFSFTIIFLSK